MEALNPQEEEEENPPLITEVLEGGGVCKGRGERGTPSGGESDSAQSKESAAGVEEGGGHVLYLWDPEGNVRFVKSHSQEERTALRRSAPQQVDGRVRALQVRERPSGLLRHVHRTQQVGMELTVVSSAHLDAKTRNYSVAIFTQL